MDFSTPTRALQSLQRRRPPLATEIVETSLALMDPKLVKDHPEEFIKGIDSLLHPTSAEAQERWEGLAVGILLATQILVQDNENNPMNEKFYIDGPRVPKEEPVIEVNGAGDPKSQIGPPPEWKPSQLLQVATWLYETALQHLEHDEPRVRTFIAKAVGAHVAWSVRQEEGTDSFAMAQKQRMTMQASLVRSIDQHITHGRDDGQNYSKSSTGALDDTTGWRALETNWQCLACCIASMGSRYFEDVASIDTQSITGSASSGDEGNNDDDAAFRIMLKHCEYSAVTHLNRHVRAAGIAVLEQMVTVAGSDSKWHSLLVLETSPLRTTVVEALKAGLADNWSQVRMAASVLNRVFWSTMLHEVHPSEEVMGKLYPILIPRMCLNRFYLAQGVKLYSHETWLLVFPESGMAVVNKTIAPLCRYYAKMCDADNHVVREAACQAVAELAVKLGMSPEYHDSLQSQVPLLLQALLMCFHDESWPVRDEACLACGTFCRAYPEECRSELETLWQRWTEQLTDQIWSVRADAAAALADAMRAYGRPFQDRLLKLINELLPSAKNQPSMTMAEFKAMQNNMDAHTDSTLYSCGSLAPKMRKAGAGRIGCSSCDVNRPRQPWEATDGCLYLLREIIDACHEEGANNADDTSALRSLEDGMLLPLMTTIADVCRVSHFPQGDDLRATLWRQLPGIAHSLGKVRMKRLYLEIFMDLMMRNLESDTSSAISKHAASACAYELSQLVGPSIFLGRIMDDRQRQIAAEILREREQEERIRNSGTMPHFHPQMQAHSPFSPFEPPGLLDNLGKQKIGRYPGMIPNPNNSEQSYLQTSGPETRDFPQNHHQQAHPGLGDSFAL